MRISVRREALGVRGEESGVRGQAVVGGDGAGDRGGFDELRPRADDCANFHACFKSQLGLGTSMIIN